MKGAAITGWGVALPDQKLDNKTLADRLEITEDWIVARTGIHERRIAADHETVSFLATAAGAEALEHAGRSAADVDEVVVATITADYRMPSAAPLVGSALGTRNAAAFDIGAGCSGFLYGLSHAAAAVHSGHAHTVLVIGADVLSRVTDYSDSKSCVLFGDGAGAVVVEASDEPSRLGPFKLYADGSRPELLWIPPDGQFISMNGREVYRQAVDAMTTSVREITSMAHLRDDDVDLVVAHQANARILAAVAQRLGLPKEKIVTNIARLGNTSAASIPLALADAVEQGVLDDGDTVVLTAFGAGFAWGAGVVKWGAPVDTAVAHIQSREAAHA